MFKNRFRVGVLVVMAALLMSASAWAVNFVDVVNPLEKIIKEAEAKQNWKDVELYTTRLVAYLRASGGHKYDSQIVSLYEKRAVAEARQGKYNESANTIRESHAWKTNPTNVDKVINYTKQDFDQRNYYNKTLEFSNKRLAIKQQIAELAKEKERLVKELLEKPSIKKEELQKLQAEFKALNEKIEGQQKELKETYAGFQKDTEELCKSDLAFNAAQSASLQEVSAGLKNVNEQVAQAQAGSQKGLLEVVEKYKIGWDGLEERLTKMQEVQVKIMDLQKKMLDLLGKTPITEAIRKEIEALKAELDKMMLTHDELLAGIESAFMNAKAFNALTPEQQSKFLDLFQVMRQARTVINETGKQIAELMKKLLVVYGDYNGDGKVDKADLEKMRRDLLNRPWLRFWRPLPYNKAADVNGDGRVNWADYNLIRSKVNGDRKTFPVDPANLVGDMDGDGDLDAGDINSLIRIVMNPKAYAGNALIKIADLNGDGKVNVTDLIELVKRMNDKKPEPVPADVSVATSSAPVEPGSAGTGEATGQTDATGQGQTGTSADSINQAY